MTIIYKATNGAKSVEVVNRGRGCYPQEMFSVFFVIRGEHKAYHRWSSEEAIALAKELVK